MNAPVARDVNALEFPSQGLPESPFSFIRLVVSGRYRFWLLALVLGESCKRERSAQRAQYQRPVRVAGGDRIDDAVE